MKRAYSKDSPSALQYFSCDEGQGWTYRYIVPYISGYDPGPAPDVAQDYYSYGTMLLRILENVPEFIAEYPLVFCCILATQKEVPGERTSLEEIVRLFGEYLSF